MQYYFAMQASPKGPKEEQNAYIAPEYFQDALLTGGTFSADYERLYGRPDKITGKAAAGNYKRSSGWFVAPSLKPVTGGQLVRDLLQDFTDDWLATGIDGQGQERPFERKLTRTQGAWDAVQKYESRPQFVIDWNNGLARRRKTLAEKLRLYSLEPAETPVRPAPRFPSEVSASSKSTNSVKVAPGSFEDLFLTGLRERRKRKRKAPEARLEDPNLPEDVIRAAELRAACLFHALMEAPWRHKLGKCKRCHCYFVLHNKPPETYARGMHCQDCKNKASADASGRTKREQRKKQFIELAADVWNAWRPKPGEDRNEWVAEQVCSLVGVKRAIQRNWVTRYEDEIKAELRKRVDTSTKAFHKDGSVMDVRAESIVSTVQRSRGTRTRFSKEKTFVDEGP